MAKITPGPMVGSVSGSVGGTTFSRNRYGMYTRRRSIPTNPQTSYQLSIRNALSAASSGWRALTAAQKAAWRTWAQANPIMDSLGQSQVLAPNAAYVQLATRLILCGGAAQDDPPIAAAPDAPYDVVLTTDIGAGNFEVAWEKTPVGADLKLIIRAAIVDSAGVTYVKNLRRILTLVNTAGTSPTALETELTNRFGTLQVGQVCFVHLQFINMVTGLYSAPVTASATVISST